MCNFKFRLNTCNILFEPLHDRTNKMTCAPSEVSGQPGHQSGQIRDFAVRSMGS